MALTLLAELKDFQLVDSDQDCRGWPVRDTAGQSLGTVHDMLVDTERKRVKTLVLDSGVQVPAADVSFKDGVVLFEPPPVDNRAAVASVASATDRKAVPFAN